MSFLEPSQSKLNTEISKISHILFDHSLVSNSLIGSFASMESRKARGTEIFVERVENEISNNTASQEELIRSSVSNDINRINDRLNQLNEKIEYILDKSPEKSQIHSSVKEKLNASRKFIDSSTHQLRSEIEAKYQSSLKHFEI